MDASTGEIAKYNSTFLYTLLTQHTKTQPKPQRYGESAYQLRRRDLRMEPLTLNIFGHASAARRHVPDHDGLPVSVFRNNLEGRGPGLA